MASERFWTVEFLAADGRKRKFHEPLFATPDGLLEAFPEKLEQLFPTFEEAQAAAGRYPPGSHGMRSIHTLSLPTLFRTARYRRWAAEMKPLKVGESFKERRMTLEESWSLYQQGGRQALRSRYTRTHVAQLLAKFRKAGWHVEETETRS